MALTEKEKSILETFEKIFPLMTDAEKERLLYMGEGMAALQSVYPDDLKPRCIA